MRGKVGVAQLPYGGAGPSPTLGGYALAVSRYSLHQAEAIQLVRFLTSREAQRDRCERIGFPPSIRSLYGDQELLQVYPHFRWLKDQYPSAVLRPSRVTGKNYPEVSEAYSHALHSVLTHQAAPEAALAQLERELARITGSPADSTAIAGRHRN